MVVTRSQVQKGEAVLYEGALEVAHMRGRKLVSGGVQEKKSKQTSIDVFGFTEAVINDFAVKQFLGRSLQYVDYACSPLRFVGECARNYYTSNNDLINAVVKSGVAIRLGRNAYKEFLEAKASYDKGQAKYAAACVATGIAYTLPAIYTVYQLK